VHAKLYENVAVARSAEHHYSETVEELFASRLGGGLRVGGEPAGTQQNQSSQNLERQAAPLADLTSEAVHRDFANFESDRRCGRIRLLDKRLAGKT